MKTRIIAFLLVAFAVVMVGSELVDTVQASMARSQARMARY